MMIPSTTRRTVATTIRRLRELGKLSQAALAHRAGIAQTAVSSCEQPDGKSPRLDTLTAIAGALDVPVWWLFLEDGGETKPCPKNADVLLRICLHLAQLSRDLKEPCP